MEEVELKPCGLCGAPCSPQLFDGEHVKGTFYFCSNSVKLNGSCTNGVYLTAEYWNKGQNTSLVDIVSDAIEKATCYHREGPYGGYDYGYNNEPGPTLGRYVIRDFRDANSPDWGKWVHQTHDREHHEEMYEKLTKRHIANAAIEAILGSEIPFPVPFINQDNLVVGTCYLNFKRDVATQEVYTDEDGVTWIRPTAWAYAQVCKALDGYKKENNNEVE